VELAQDHSFSFEEPFEELHLASTDGVMLNGLYFRRASARGLVLYFHGNSGNVEICSRHRKRFLDLGYDFMIVDYRGYGKSTGDIAQQGIYSDALTAWNYALTRWPADSIVVYGSSLGSGPGVWLASHQPVGRLLLEAPYAGIDLIAHERYPIFPTGLLLKNPFPSRTFAPKVKAAVTIFHGEQDQVVPFAQSAILEDSLTGATKVTRHAYPNAGHNDVPKQPDYPAHLREALK
jgi:fermentation-respiration switch protein FrsA (DUF1100 family)